ncbi:MAG: AraC family transcriptional regulator [Chitinophagaceae bacterium]
MFRIDFSNMGYEQLMHEVAERLQARVHNNQLIFPPEIATGHYSFVKLPNGLEANILNCTFNQDWLIRRRKSPEEEYYTLRFDELTIRDSLVVTIDDEKMKEGNTTKSVAYLTSSLSDWSYFGTEGSTFKGIQVLFNKKWLAKYLDINTVENVLSTYISLKAENINIEPLDSKYKQWMRMVMETDEEHPMRLAVIQNRIMLMIERFFTHLYEKMQNPTFRIPLSSEDINRVMQVESILTKDIYQSPPSIQELARMTAISESKLKKDFKTMYGYPIYEYYQKTRMQAAQDKLLTGKYSVKEVAMELGYANLSNFTIAFKKEFGILPSQLLSSH